MMDDKIDVVIDLIMRLFCDGTVVESKEAKFIERQVLMEVSYDSKLVFFFLHTKATKCGYQFFGLFLKFLGLLFILGYAVIPLCIHDC